MKRIIVAAIAAILAPSSAHAAVTITVNQSGSSVVVNGSGSFDTTGLRTYSTGNQGGSFINAASGVVSVGAAAPITIFTGLSGPVLGYLQGPKYATSSSGDTFGFSQYLGAIYLPSTYQSNAQLSGSSVYQNTSLASLGLSVGQYVFRSANDSVTLNVTAGAVPEPATWALMILGMGAVGFAMRRRKNVNMTVRFA